MSGTERVEGCFAAFGVWVDYLTTDETPTSEVAELLASALRATGAFYRVDPGRSTSRPYGRPPRPAVTVGPSPEQYKCRVELSVLPRDPAVRGPLACEDLDDLVTAAVAGVAPGARDEVVRVSLARAAALLASSEEEYAALPGPGGRPRAIPLPVPPTPEELAALASDPAWGDVYPRARSVSAPLVSYLRSGLTPAEAVEVEVEVVAHLERTPARGEVLFPRVFTDHGGVFAEVRRHLDENPGTSPAEAARVVLGS